LEKILNNNNQDYVDKTNNDFFKRDMEKIGRDIPK